MASFTKKVRARLHGNRLELLEDVELPDGVDVMLVMQVRSPDRVAVVAALRASAGAWSATAHPELRSRDEAIRLVRGLRGGSVADD